MGIKALEIEKFRSIENQMVELGDKITIIAGQNGTGKSTILGMLGQPFNSPGAFKTVFGKSFKTKFSEIFKMSPNYDLPGGHRYFVLFDSEDICGKEREEVNSIARTEDGNKTARLWVGPNREKGSGNITYPVIYLGLKRVSPLGEAKGLNVKNYGLTQEDIDFYNTLYTSVFSTLESGSPVGLNVTGGKSTFAASTSRYDHLANSAGQDNLGQIFGALLSFKKLKEQMGNEYKGGLLLIDELDVTMYPSALYALFDILLKYAGKLGIQVVFTTHSIQLVQKAYSHPSFGHNGDIKINYFVHIGQNSQIEINPPIENIVANLNIELIPLPTVEKIELLCEDNEAQLFCNKLLSAENKKRCTVVSAELGCGELKNLAEKKLNCLSSVLFVLDGDQTYPPRKKKPATVVILPDGGHKLNPENIIREFLTGLNPNDELWTNVREYTHQMFVKSLNNATGGEYNNREKMKAWFKGLIGSQAFGRSGSVLFKRWKEENATAVEKFNADVTVALDALAKSNNAK